MATTGTKQQRTEWYRQWYADPVNRAKQKENSARNKVLAINRNRDFVNQYKKTHPCEECGESRFYCLDFHHLRDKEKEVATGVTIGWSIERLKKEIEKCRLLCKNCHAEVHYEIRGVSSVG